MAFKENKITRVFHTTPLRALYHIRGSKFFSIDIVYLQAGVRYFKHVVRACLKGLTPAIRYVFLSFYLYQSDDLGLFHIYVTNVDIIYE